MPGPGLRTVQWAQDRERTCCLFSQLWASLPPGPGAPRGPGAPCSQTASQPRSPPVPTSPAVQPGPAHSRRHSVLRAPLEATGSPARAALTRAAAPRLSTGPFKAAEPVPGQGRRERVPPGPAWAAGQGRAQPASASARDAGAVPGAQPRTPEQRAPTHRPPRPPHTGPRPGRRGRRRPTRPERQGRGGASGGSACQHPCPAPRGHLGGGAPSAPQEVRLAR